MNLRVLAFVFVLAAVAVSQQSNPVPPPKGGQRDPGLFKGEKPGKGDENVRSVSGSVRLPNEDAVDGAIVQLKDTKSLKVRSFITQTDGSYRFHGLSTNVDYELSARFKDLSSDIKTLSVYDSRKQAILNFKVQTKQEREKEKSEQ